MTAREWISENYDWDRSGRGYIAKKDGRLYLISDVAESYSQAENERLRGCLNAITAALGVKQSKQGLTTFERELRQEVRAALRSVEKK